MKVLNAGLLERLKKLSPSTICAVGLVYVLAVALADRVTPPRLNFTLFYLFGSVFVGWAAGKRQAMVVALVSVMAIVAHDWQLHRADLPAWVTIWNLLTRFIVVTAGGWLSAEVSRLTRNLGRLAEARTAQRNAEAQRHKTTAESLRAFLDAIPEPAFLLDRKGTVLLCNQALARALNLPVEAILGQYVFGLLPAEVGQLRKTMFEEVLRSARPVRYEDTREGKHLLSFQSPVLDAEGKVSCVAMLALDITQRKRAEQALRLSQRQLAEAMDLARMANWEYDVATRLFTVDDRFFRLYGTSIEREGSYQISPETYLREFLYPEDGPLVLSCIEKALDTADPNYSVQVERRIRRRDGQTRHMLALIAITKDAAGRTIKIRGVNQDITERKLLERQILEISDREQARIGQDLHDGLCQQLVSLAFDANSLERNLSSRQQPEAATARRIADLLDQAITEARQLSRGLFPIRLEADGLASALEELARGTSERLPVACCFQCTGPVSVKDRAIATHLFRIAQEAVTNAVKHGHPKHIRIELHAQAEALELSVADDGSGIDLAAPAKASSMGLHIMDYRARTIGATFRLVPGEQGGTMVSCRLPFNQGCS